MREAKFGEELFFVKSLEFSTDGTLLLSANYPPPASRGKVSTPCVRLWDPWQFHLRGSFAEGSNPVNNACFSRNAELVVFSHPSGPDLKVEFSREEMASLTPVDLQNAAERAKRDLDNRLELGKPEYPALIRVWNVKTNA